LRSANRNLNSRQSAACVRALALIGSWEAFHAMQSTPMDSSSQWLREVIGRGPLRPAAVFASGRARVVDVKVSSWGRSSPRCERFGTERMKAWNWRRHLSLSGVKASHVSILQCLPGLESLDLRDSGSRPFGAPTALANLRSLIFRGRGQRSLAPVRPS